MFCILSQRKYLSVLKSAWAYGPNNLERFQPTRGFLSCCSLCPGPFCFAGLCQPFSVFFTTSISRKQTHTICSFVPIFNYPPFSFFLAPFPHPILSFFRSGKCFIQTSTRTSVSWLLTTIRESNGPKRNGKAWRNTEITTRISEKKKLMLNKTGTNENG